MEQSDTYHGMDKVVSSTYVAGDQFLCGRWQVLVGTMSYHYDERYLLSKVLQKSLTADVANDGEQGCECQETHSEQDTREDL